jgi:uncharacterized small protein (DUF1192 family)
MGTSNTERRAKRIAELEAEIERLLALARQKGLLRDRA